MAESNGSPLAPEPEPRAAPKTVSELISQLERVERNLKYYQDQIDPLLIEHGALLGRLTSIVRDRPDRVIIGCGSAYFVFPQQGGALLRREAVYAHEIPLDPAPEADDPDPVPSDNHPVFDRGNALADADAMLVSILSPALDSDD